MPFDQEKADHAIGFINCLTHTKGRWAGSSFTHLPWQTEFHEKLFGTVKENGYRQYRFGYLEIPKKNGKSEDAAAIALEQLVADGEQGAEVYSAAGDKEQAGLVYHVAAQMVRNNRQLRKRLKVLDSRKRIIDYRTNSFYQVLSSESYTKHGINPSCIIFDELHAQPNRELFDVLTDGTDAARTQQLVVILTTAGIYDVNSIAWEVHDHAVKVRDGIVEDPSFLPMVYGLDADADYEDEDLWKEVNPAFDHIFDMDHLKVAFAQAKESPVKLQNFRRLRLNQWLNQILRWLPMDKWDACGGPVDKGTLLKRTCFGALDLSSTIDLASFELVFPPVSRGEKWKILSQFFVPEENIRKRAKKDRVPYDLWARAGLIKATSGNVIDYGFIRKAVNNAANIYDLREVAYDPWGAVKLATELAEEDGIPMVEHRQGFKSMSPPTKELLKMVLGGELAHGGHKVLRWCADNLVVKIDAAENVKPEKDKARERIDGIVALIMALGRAIVNFDESSIYDEQGIMFI